MHFKTSLAAALVAVAPISGSVAATPALVPLPAKVSVGEGRFKLDATTMVIAPDSLRSEAKELAERLSLVSGLTIRTAATGKGISLALDSGLPAEGYSLEIQADSVSIRGNSAAGVFHGIQTFLQTLPPAAFGNAAAPKADWSAPAMKIEDAPTCSWRGLHLDSSRHFQPKAFVLKFLDAMAAHKLNRLHWHLVDSEGWRLEIKKIPETRRGHQGRARLFSRGNPHQSHLPREIPLRPSPRRRILHAAGCQGDRRIR